MAKIKAEAKGKDMSLMDYLWNHTEDSRKQELENELGKILKNTKKGLKRLHHFLDAVEKLAVTSHFCMSESFMPSGVSSMSIRSVIFAARMVSPLLVHFKRDAEAFFRPKLSNVDVLALQLEKYIRVTQQICEKMEKKAKYMSGSVRKWKNWRSSLKFNLNVSEESVQERHEHLLQLTKIRMDESFRMIFLFGVKAQDFIKLFNKHRSRMFQFLSDLEETTVQLDKMKKGSDISSVAGSSVGIAGGLCSIAGLALAPFTAGLSLGLMFTGVGLGVTSGVTGVVTGFTEMAVNSHHGKKANGIFISFMEDVQKILDCVEDVGSRKVLHACDDAEVKQFDAVGDADLIKNNIRLEGAVSNLKTLETTTIRTYKVASIVDDLLDIGQLAKGSSLAISKSARAGFIGLNTLFIGLDVFYICKDGMNLAKGSENKVAQIIRSRAALWRSEVEAWEKIYNHLCEGMLGFYKNQEILNKTFYI
ncbi:apolipoprotein L3-like isoform 3-T3 [Clarias gariepinus]